MVCWFSQKPFKADGRYVLHHTSHEVRCQVQQLLYKMDINTLHRLTDAAELSMNDIGRVRLRTSQPVFYDAYRRNRFTGSVIFIDEQTNETVGAGMIL
jgi:sulfate adenylyltransferase subunit 1